MYEKKIDKKGLNDAYSRNKNFFQLNFISRVV